MSLLVETAQHFNINNRGAEGTSCSFGKKCALGRKMTPSLRKKLDYLMRHATGFYKIFLLLPKELRDCGEKFLGDLMNFHDIEDYWNEAGLSEDGEYRCKMIARDILAGRYMLPHK